MFLKSSTVQAKNKAKGLEKDKYYNSLLITGGSFVQ